jgi:hypothetical protein
MTERIEELIVAYLHRGSTPEQEQELFEACRSNPDTANLLRQHIVMSLKLRQLRDTVEVPAEARNALLRRLNELPAQEAPPRRRSVLPAWAMGVRFGLHHLVGVAGATAMLFVGFLLLRPDTGTVPGTAGMAALQRDTVMVTATDTLFLTREVRKPVYIYRAAQEGNSVTGVAVREQPADDGIAEAREPQPEPSVTPPVLPDRGTGHPSIAANTTPEAPAYLQQYNEMVLSLEKVRLSSSDRVRN